MILSILNIVAKVFAAGDKCEKLVGKKILEFTRFWMRFSPIIHKEKLVKDSYSQF